MPTLPRNISTFLHCLGLTDISNNLPMHLSNNLHLVNPLFNHDCKIIIFIESLHQRIEKIVGPQSGCPTHHNICGENFVLNYTPHQYPNKILSNWSSQSCACSRIVERILRPCFNVLINLSTIPLHLGH